MHAKNNNYNLSINHCEKANEMRFFNLLLEFIKLMFQLQCLFFANGMFWANIYFFNNGRLFFFEFYKKNSEKSFENWSSLRKKILKLCTLVEVEKNMWNRFNLNKKKYKNRSKFKIEVPTKLVVVTGACFTHFLSHQVYQNERIQKA